MNNELIKKLVDWIVANRYGHSFNYPHNKIANVLLHAYEQDVFVVSHSNGIIHGVACGEKSIKDHHIFIHDVLTTRKGIVKEFLMFCHSKYPDWPIYGTVRNRYRLISNPVKFARRIK